MVQLLVNDISRCAYVRSKIALLAYLRENFILPPYSKFGAATVIASRALVARYLEPQLLLALHLCVWRFATAFYYHTSRCAHIISSTCASDLVLRHFSVSSLFS